MKEIKEIYKCDLCKQEVDDIRDLFLPYEVVEEGVVSFISLAKMFDKKYLASKKFKICQECAKRIVEDDRNKNSDWIFQIIGE